MAFNPEMPAGGKKTEEEKKTSAKPEDPDLLQAQERILTEAEEILAREQRKKEKARAAAIEADIADVSVVEEAPAKSEEQLIEEAQMGYASEGLAPQTAVEEKPEAVSEPEAVMMGEDPYMKAQTDYDLARAEELEKNRDADPIYEAVLVKFLLDAEKYMSARREIFHKLEMDRGALKAEADKRLTALKLKLGRKFDDSVKLGLKDVLDMQEFKAERENLKQLFQEAYFLGSQVEEYREEMMRSQRRFRDTNDAAMRQFMQRAADPKAGPLREVKLSMPISTDFYLEETSEDDFRRGKAQPPVDAAVVNSIEFFKKEAQSVPEDFVAELK